MVCQPAFERSSQTAGREAVDLHVGRRLKARRILANMSQERLAAALGISYQQLQRYEAGKGRFPSAMLFRAATTLNVPIGYFFEQLPDDGMATTEPVVDKSTLTIVRKLQQVSNPDTLLCLTRLIEELGKPAAQAKAVRR